MDLEESDRRNMKKKKQFSREQVLAELYAISAAPTGEFFRHRDDPENISPAALTALAAYEQSGSAVKFKFYDKLQALELLGKFMGLEAESDGGEPGLLSAILLSTKEDLHEVSALQPETASGNDLVEQGRN